MKVLIIGANETALHIASQFIEENYEVTVVDEHPKLLQQIKKRLNIAGFIGNPTNISLLENAGLRKTDLLITCTESDETNLFVCLLVKQFNNRFVVLMMSRLILIQRKKYCLFRPKFSSLILNPN